MKRLLQILNAVTLVFTIVISYFFNGREGKQSISDLSAKYDNLLTPAGYAFGIWGLIYVLLIIFVIYQFRDITNKPTEKGLVMRVGWWFIIANLANAAWVWAFTSDQTGLSLLIMVAIFFSLLKVVLHTNMERWDAPNKVIFFVWWPFSAYFGWITVALIINTSAYLTSIGWDGRPLSAETWAILVLLIATAIFITMVWKRNMREYASIGVWGVAAIAVKNWDMHPVVAWTAVAVCVLITINTMVHGHQNRATGPFAPRDRTNLIEDDYGKSEH